MRIFFLLIFPNLPITFSEHWVFLASQDALEVMGVTHWVSHCTMGHAVEINILEVFKSKQILHAHLWSENVHSFCEWCKTTNILGHILCFLCVEKLNGRSDKVEILITWNFDHLQQKSPKWRLCQYIHSWWIWVEWVMIPIDTYRLKT